MRYDRSDIMFLLGVWMVTLLFAFVQGHDWGCEKALNCAVEAGVAEWDGTGHHKKIVWLVPEASNPQGAENGQAD